MIKTISRFLLLVSLLLQSHLLFAQTTTKTIKPKLVFSHIPNKNKFLEKSAYFGVIPDKKNNLWISTDGGLLKFNGKELVFSEEYSNAGLGRFTGTIAPAGENSVFIGTSAGLASFNLLTHVITNHTHVKGSNDGSLLPFDERAVSLLSNKSSNEIIIGQDNHLVQYDLASKSFSQIKLDELEKLKESGEISRNKIGFSSLYQDPNDSLWIGTYTDGVFSLNPKNAEFSVYQTFTEKAENIKLTMVHEIVPLPGDTDRLMIGAAEGLFIFDKNKGLIERFPKKRPIKDPIQHITVADNGDIWVAGNNAYQITNDQFLVTYDRKKDFKISKNSSVVDYIYIDEQETVFVFFSNVGVYRASPTTSKARIINDFPVSSLEVWALKIDSAGRAWIGLNGGVFFGKMVNGLFEYEEALKEDGSSFGNVWEITDGINGEVWVAETNSLTQISATNEIKTYDLKSVVRTKGDIKNFVQDKSGDIWILFDKSKGFEIFKPGSGKVSAIESLSHLGLEAFPKTDIHLSPDRDMLFFATTSLKGFIDIESKLISLEHEKLLENYWKKSLTGPGKNRYMYHTVQSSDMKNVYLAHSRKHMSVYSWGCNCFELVEYPFENMVENLASFSNQLFWLVDRDTKVVVWDSTNKEHTELDFNHGIPETGVYGSIGIAFMDGKALFGSNDGLVLIDTKLLGKYKFRPQTILDELYVNNVKQVPGDSKVIETRISYENSIKLDHFQNDITISFNSNLSSSHSNVEYSYRLVGLKDVWLDASNENPIATYTNIPSGNYIFEVKSSNNDGIWGEARQLKIYIVPAWYETKTAYTSIVFLLLIAFYGTYRGARKRNARQEQILLEKVEEQTGQIKKDAILISNQNKLLIKNNVRIKELVISIAHELRTPLSVINGINTKIKSLGNNLEVKDLIKQSNRNISGISRKIDLLLLRAKLENKAQIPSIKLNLSTETKALVEQFKVVAEVNGYFFDSQIEENVGVQGDPYAFEQLVANLISNAIKYNSHRGSIGVYLTRDSDTVVFTVTDTGRGISQEGITKITDKWSQESISNMNSSGLGMSLVKEITDYYQGTLHIDSELGKGTKVSVTLPCFTTSEESQRLSPSSGAIITRELSHTENYFDSEELASAVYCSPDKVPEGEFILLVEDNAELATQLSEQLNSVHKTIVARNGVHALELIDIQLPSIIVSDILMPDMDGFELVTKVKNTPNLSFIPFILLTANADEDVKLEGLELGANDFLAKPVNEKELRFRINNIFSQLAAYQEQLAALPVYGSQEIKAPAGTTSQLIKANEFKHKMAKWMENIFPDNPTVGDAAIEFGFSNPDKFTKYFKSLMGVQPSKYISRYKVEKAAKLLTDSEMSLVDISLECGFNTTTHLSREFRKVYSSPPGKFRSDHKNTPII